MSISSIAGVMARISAIESRFGVERPSSSTASSGSAGARSSNTPTDFDQVFGSVLGSGPLGSTAVPWSQVAGDIRTLSPSQFSSGMNVALFEQSAPPTITTGASAVPGSSAGVAGVAGAAPNDLESLDARPVAPGTPFADHFNAAGARHGVPPRLLASIGYVESRYQTDAVSPDGAEGVMQLMPFVSEHYGVDPRNPAEAIDAAGQLLAEHHERFGSWDLSVASYFSGAGAVSRAGNTPPTARSHDYVRKVTERLPAT